MIKAFRPFDGTAWARHLHNRAYPIARNLKKMTADDRCGHFYSEIMTFFPLRFPT